MAILKGEVTFKVTFKDLGVPIGMYSTAVINHECARTDLCEIWMV